MSTIIETYDPPLACPYCSEKGIRSLIQKKNHDFYKCDSCGREILSAGRWIGDIGRQKKNA